MRVVRFTTRLSTAKIRIAFPLNLQLRFFNGKCELHLSRKTHLLGCLLPKSTENFLHSRERLRCFCLTSSSFFCVLLLPRSRGSHSDLIVFILKCVDFWMSGRELFSLLTCLQTCGKFTRA